MPTEMARRIEAEARLRAMLAFVEDGDAVLEAVVQAAEGGARTLATSAARRAELAAQAAAARRLMTEREHARKPPRQPVGLGSATRDG